jgi:hypothetical protein
LINRIIIFMIKIITEYKHDEYEYNYIILRKYGKIGRFMGNLTCYHFGNAITPYLHIFISYTLFFN